MRNRLHIAILLFAGLSLFAACRHDGTQQNKKKGFGSKQRDLIALYDKADSVYHFKGRADTALFERFIRKAVDFAQSYPKDEMAPDMLYRAGVGSMILAKSAPDRDHTAQYAKQAIEIFNTYQSLFPDGEKAEFCYYQRGIIYDDILGDSRSAESEYRDYINRNPGDSISIQLEQYIKFLGKTEEEIAKEMGIE